MFWLKEQIHPSSAFLFCRVLMDWMLSNYVRMLTFFPHLLIQMLIFSENTLTDTPRNNVASYVGMP